MCVCVCLLSLVKIHLKIRYVVVFSFFFFFCGSVRNVQIGKTRKNVYKGPGGRSIVDPIKSALLSPCCCCTHTKTLSNFDRLLEALSLSLHWVVQQHFVAHHLLRSFLADETHKKTERVDKYNKRLRQKQERTTPCWGALVESLNLVHGAHLKIERAHTRSI